MKPVISRGSSHGMMISERAKLRSGNLRPNSRARLKPMMNWKNSDRNVKTLLERRVDGIIVTGRRQDLREPIGRNLPVPVVYAMTHSSDPADLSLLPDDEEGGAVAVRHLLSTGRTNIGHVTGPPRFRAARLRAKGATDTLAAAGLELAGGDVLFGEWSEEWGRQAADMLLRSAPGLDAIFCGNDQIARGVADVAREAGRHVPGDVALVGFDNWEVMATACRPPLTTVDMNLRELGRTAGENLLAAIEGHPSAGLRLLPCSLVLRESSRPRQAAMPGTAGGMPSVPGQAGPAPAPPAVPGQPAARVIS